MSATSAVRAMLILFEALSPDEREEAFDRLTDSRLQRLAGEESETARMIRSLRSVAAYVGAELSPDLYRDGYRDLEARGEDVIEINKVIRHFGTWRRAKEALSLSDTTTARRIDARFRSRRVGKVWRYTEATLRETLTRCVAHYGRAPLVAEFEWWRDRELELAAAEGNDSLHLPSPTPYRKRWRTWEGALRHFGYDRETIENRLEMP